MSRNGFFRLLMLWAIFTWSNGASDFSAGILTPFENHKNKRRIS
jgi:hypothetical protein